MLLLTLTYSDALKYFIHILHHFNTPSSVYTQRERMNERGSERTIQKDREPASQEGIARNSKNKIIAHGLPTAMCNIYIYLMRRTMVYDETNKYIGSNIIHDIRP